MRQTTRASVFASCLSLCLALVLGVTPASVAAKVSAPADSPLRPAAILTVISGDVQVRVASGDFTSAVDGAVLYVGNTVRTSADARAVITLFEGSTMELEPASDITIEDATPGSGSTFVGSLGRSWHVVTRLTTADSRHELRTPAATASVRGIEFEVTVDEALTGSAAALTTTGLLIATPAVAMSVAVADETKVVASSRTETVRGKSAPAPQRASTQVVRFGRAIWSKDGKTFASPPAQGSHARDHQSDRDRDEGDHEDDREDHD